jgi:exoribonuclease-2
VKVTRMTYDEAEEVLDQPPLAELVALARVLERRRRLRGAIVIDLPEVKIRVEGQRVHIRPLFPLHSRMVVSEAMLAAGEAAARFAQARDIALPYAVQDPPLAEEWPTGMAGMFAQRRSLKPSQQSTVPRAHAGLGLDSYTRVTSPLRRYLDLVVHQQLRAYVRGEPLLDSGSILARVGAAEAVTDSLRRCERLVRQHWTLVYLLQHPGWQGEGILVEQTGPRSTVLIPELAWETRIHLRSEIPLNGPIPLVLSEVNLPALEAFFQVVSGH